MIEATTCGVPGCPADAPLTGTDCTCQEGLQCDYSNCSAGTGWETHAKCLADPAGASVWDVFDTVCPTGEPCGDSLVCLPGQICVTTEINFTYQYGCADDPCAPYALDCSCAAQLCNVACTVQDLTHLLCSCPTCG
jgi:hypothetical protein